jgi:hypothetical protein
MKKKCLLFLGVGLLLICFASASSAWQGRMSGMGDPFGLVSDESDLLVHPAKIVDGKGSNYYGDYKFDYHQITKWENIATFTIPNTSVFLIHSPLMATGSERDHDASLGGTWAFGPGRIGIFVHYALKEGSYGGSNNFNQSGSLLQDSFALDTDADSFAVRLLYGLQIGAWKLGTEVGFSHKSHQNFTDYLTGDGVHLTNNPLGAMVTEYDTFTFMTPDDSSWNEAALKISAERAIGPGVLILTPKIATKFHGVNNINNLVTFGSVPIFNVLSTGNVSGWSAGADLWYRVRLDDSTSLPFLMRADYDLTKMNSSGIELGFIFSPSPPVNFSSERKYFLFETGGGIDKEITKQTRVAGGIYYDYLQSKNSFIYNQPGDQSIAHNEYPNEREHRVVLKIAGEQTISPMFTARLGINAYYGWVRDHFNYTDIPEGDPLNSTMQDISTSGHHWGLTASAGATVKVARLDIEPFLFTGVQKTHTDTDSGSRIVPGMGITPFSVDLESRKNEWSFGGGLSIKY